MPTYDDQRPQTLPDDDELRRLTGIDKPHEQAIDRRAGAAAKGTPAQGGDQAGRAGPTGPEALRNAEHNPADHTVGKGFNPTDTARRGLSRESIKAAIASRKGRAALIGGAAGFTITGLLIAGFMLLIPLKIEHIVQNLRDRFYATSQQAVQTETTNLFEDYLKNHVFVGLKTCTEHSTVSKDCRASVTGNSPISNLFRGWRDGRLENTLATKYHLEFKYDPYSKAYYIKAPGTSSSGDNLGHLGEKLDQEFLRTDRQGVRQAVRDSLKNETLWKRAMYRFKIGRLLEEKYGIKRCIVFCGVKDALTDHVHAQQKAAKLYLAERVIKPRNQEIYAVIQCLLDDGCHPGKTTATPCTEGQDCEMHGAPESPTDSEMRTKLEEYAAKLGLGDAEKLTALYNEIADKGFQRYFAEKAFQLIFTETTAKSLADKLPAIGWINMAAHIINVANDAGPKLRKLSYIINAASAVQIFSMYSTYADEIHTGHVTATEAGSFVNSLGSGNYGTPNDPQIGGTGGAETTPLYSQLIDGTPARTANTTASLSGALLPKAYAAGTAPAASSANTYLCNDGKPPTSVVCPEEVLGQGNNAANSIHAFFAAPGGNVLATLARAWGDSIGKLFNMANSFFAVAASPIFKSLDASCSKLPSVITAITPLSAYCGLRSAALAAAPYVTKAITQKLIQSPVSSNMSGGRTFDMMAAGADVSGNTFAHHGLGGKLLTPTQVATIVNQQQSQAEQQFRQQTFFARMFDTSSPYSFISRLAMAVPFNAQAYTASTVSGLLSNPLGNIMSGLASVFSPPRAFADIGAQNDPFGVPQYGYTAADIPSDPEAYWNKNCSGGADKVLTQAWNDAAANDVNSANGMPTNKTVDACLLIEASVGSAGAVFSSSTLTPDDLGQSGPSQPVTSTTSSSHPTIVLDPGHSGTDISIIDPQTGLNDHDYPNQPEMDDVFTVAQMIQHNLVAAGYKVIMTKQAVNDTVSLRQRATIANQANAALAVSIHDDPGEPWSNFAQIYVQQDGLYRTGTRGQVTFNNPSVAALSQQYGQIFAQERTAAEGRPAVITQVNFNGRAGLDPGNIPMVQLFATVPWVYNEVGAAPQSQHMSQAHMDAYAQGLTNAIEKSVPIK